MLRRCEPIRPCGSGLARQSARPLRPRPTFPATRPESASSLVQSGSNATIASYWYSSSRVVGELVENILRVLRHALLGGLQQHVALHRPVAVQLIAEEAILARRPAGHQQHPRLDGRRRPSPTRARCRADCRRPAARRRESGKRSGPPHPARRRTTPAPPRRRRRSEPAPRRSTCPTAGRLLAASPQQFHVDEPARVTGRLGYNR